MIRFHWRRRRPISPVFVDYMIHVRRDVYDHERTGDFR